MQPLPAFEQRFEDQNYDLFGWMGAALSLMVGWLVWTTATGRERALGLAHRMTQALRSTRDDLESTLNAIPDLLFEMGLDGRIYHYRSARSSLLAVPPEMFPGPADGRSSFHPRPLLDGAPHCMPPRTRVIRSATSTPWSWGARPTGSSCRSPARKRPHPDSHPVSSPCPVKSPSASRPKPARACWPT